MKKPLLSFSKNEQTELSYEGYIRDGQFGQKSSEPCKIWKVVGRGLEFLWPFPKIDYEDEKYRLSVNGSAEISHYLKLHANQQEGYWKIIKPLIPGPITVADCGCGGGALLDVIKSRTAASTIGIEPFKGFHPSLAQRGHSVFGSLEEAVQRCENKIDLALSVHVIEHVVDPVCYLREILNFTKPGGKLVVITPNLNDVLMNVDREKTAPFFYRKVHNYYFTAKSLGWVAELAGWKCESDIFYHEFGMSNALMWLRDGKPAGHMRLGAITDGADSWWKAYLESTGQSNNVGVVLVKPDTENRVFQT